MYKYAWNQNMIEKSPIDLDLVTYKDYQKAPIHLCIGTSGPD